MTQEEKALAYDKALERAQCWLNSHQVIEDCDYTIEDAIQSIFPELLESEDEKIRKTLIEMFSSVGKKDWRDIPTEKIIAWFEKQGEQKSIGFNIGDTITVNGEICKVVAVEQVPIEWKQDNIKDLTEFESAMMHIGGSFFGNNAGLDPNDTSVIKEQANLLMELVPKQEWSKEDEILYESALWHVKNSCGNGGKNSGEFEVYNWLKSLKDRVQPQSWKPSEEQMIALRQVISGCSYDIEPLLEIEEQLKKL